MERFSRMLRSGLAMVLAICMIISACPVVAFAAETDKDITYVSIGDSMANGYGMKGYNQNSSGNDYDFLTGYNVYGTKAYPNSFAEYLGTYGNVEHIKLATSGMIAPKLLYVLGGTDVPVNEIDGWAGYNHYVGNYTTDQVNQYFRDSVAKADVISLGIGNGSFGAYLMAMLTSLVGMNGSPDDVPNVTLSDALALVKGDEAMKQLLQEQYNSLKSKLVAAAAGVDLPIDKMCDIIVYAAAGHMVGLKGVLEQIEILNEKDKLEVVLVGLSNNLAGVKLGDVDLGSAMDTLFKAMNAYLAGLPTAMQAAGQLEGITFYYADVLHPEFISEIFVEMYADGKWNSPTYAGVMDVNTMRDRTINAVDNYVFKNILGSNQRDAIKNVMNGKSPSAEDFASDLQNAALPYVVTGAYLGIEKAVAANISNKDIPLSSLIGLTNLKALLGDTLTIEGMSSVFANGMGANYDVEAGMNAVAEQVYNLMNTGDFKGMCTLFGMFLVGDGIAAHPSAAGHDAIANEVIKAYAEGHTAKDETVENIKYVLGEMKGFLETYGPQAADQLLKIWEEEGYQAIVDETITELEETLTARYNHYKDVVVPALTQTVEGLKAQKTELTAQLTTLNQQLAEKKAELEKVISEQEIGSIYNPDINIDTELGNNEQTQVPDNDCEGAGNVADELAAAVADIEHAIEVVKALIADVEADIEDMVALAAEIAEAIAELEKTMASVAAAAKDLKDAFDAIYAVLTDENAQAASQSFINIFNTAREAALAAADALELIVETVTDDVAAIDASLNTLTEGLDKLYNNFDPAHAESALKGIIEILPEEVIGTAGAAAVIMEQLGIDKEAVLTALETAKGEALTELNTKIGEIETKLTSDLTALAKEYEPQIQKALTELEAKKTEVQNKIKAEYAAFEQEALADIEALKIAAEAELKALNEELAGYQAQLEGAAEDAIEGIQAQIDRVNGDIAKINEDLACAIEHINTALKAEYDKIVEKVTNEFKAVLDELETIYNDLVNAYNTAIEDLKKAAEQAIKDLEALYNKTIDELIAEADKAIQDLIDAANKKIEELGDLADDVKEIINGIYDAIRDEVKKAQDALYDILHGGLDSINDLKDALVDLGIDAVNALVDELTSLIEDLLHQATYADLNVDDGFLYVALGDDTALPEGYVELVAEKIEEEKNLEDGVDILFKNYAKAGNTVAKERKNLSNVADADLITIGFGNVNMLKTAVDAGLNGKSVSYNWPGLVGKDVAPYVEDALADVFAEIDASIDDVEMAGAAKAAVESIAYSSVEYAVELPQLIAEIREVNDDALIIVVGQYNPMDGAVLDLMGNTMDLNKYIEYFVDAVAVHGIAFSLISGDAIFAEAPDVNIEEMDSQWSVLDLAKMLQNDFATLNPSEAGDVYIANQILKALNITQLNEVPVPFFIDVQDPNAYYYDPVMWAVKMGITTGYTEEIFAPNDSCTRAHVVTFLWRAAGCPTPKSNNNTFWDVEDDYYTEAVLWAAENGITQGTVDAETFEPHRACTRAEIVTMLSRYLNGKPSSSNNPFVDVPEDYYTEAVLWAAENGITQGTVNAETFEPHRTCTRAEIVTFLFRALYQHR